MGWKCFPGYKNITKEKLETHLKDKLEDVQEDISIENLNIIFWALCEIIQTSKFAAKILTKMDRLKKFGLDLRTGLNFVDKIYTI